MRLLFAFAIAILAIAGMETVRAADLSAPGAGAGASPARSAWILGARAEPVVIIDDEPGVVLRDYWLPPWHNHHYFPMTGRVPRLGRRENLSLHARYRPARSFYRVWSTPLFRNEAAPPCAPALKRPRCSERDFN